MMLASKSRGFTLIELLIVIAIMMTVAGLVGGLTLDMKEKFEIKRETKKLSMLIQRASQRAFIEQDGLQLTVSAKTFLLKRQPANDALLTEVFEHLSFPEQRISFNRQGLPSAMSLRYAVNQNSKTLNLQGLFGEN